VLECAPAPVRATSLKVTECCPLLAPGGFHRWASVRRLYPKAVQNVQYGLYFSYYAVRLTQSRRISSEAQLVLPATWEPANMLCFLLIRTKDVQRGQKTLDSVITSRAIT
jgi:hypothetical protein